MPDLSPNECEWRETMDGPYATACGELWEFNDGTPSENKCKFCPYCGKPLRVVPYEGEPLEGEADE